MTVATSIRIRQVGPCFAGEVEGLDLRRPLSPEENAADIWKRVRDWHLPPPSAETLPMDIPPPLITVWVEDKYDGIRAQIHKVGKTAAIYSRDLKEITRSFEEIADLARQLPEDFICDGEIVAMRGEQVLPYAELQKRLGRREARS